MNSEDALKFVTSLVEQGRFRRISSEGRGTKAIIFQTASGLNFAVEINDVKSRGYATQTKIVCERSPDGDEIDWDEIAQRLPITLNDRQFASSAYKLKGARLEPGRQKSVLVESIGNLEEFLEWYGATGSKKPSGERFSRRVIEAAMDAFDRFRESGEHREVFGGFGDPRDYWVRSTRDRANRVYPTKPLIGFISKKKELNGGWGQKSDAAARLHNSGFIIVGEDDKPVPPPERYAHLVRDADRIRLCALNYFIEPARERGASEVTIRAGDLAAAIGLQTHFQTSAKPWAARSFSNWHKCHRQLIPNRTPAVRPSSPTSSPRRKGTNP
jgi:5-methylcytosine-specific restriction protein B